jgi:hypothetical protein
MDRLESEIRYKLRVLEILDSIPEVICKYTVRNLDTVYTELKELHYDTPSSIHPSSDTRFDVSAVALKLVGEMVRFFEKKLKHTYTEFFSVYSHFGCRLAEAKQYACPNSVAEALIADAITAEV